MSDLLGNNLKIGNLAPDFICDSTMGRISFHEYLGSSWGILFSHPKDFTPVCTTELAEAAALEVDWRERDVKLLAYSVDDIPSHLSWKEDVEKHGHCNVYFPILDGSDRKIAILYGMLDVENLPKENEVPVTVRSVFIIDPNKRIRLIIRNNKKLKSKMNSRLDKTRSMQLLTRKPRNVSLDPKSKILTSDFNAFKKFNEITLFIEKNSKYNEWYWYKHDKYDWIPVLLKEKTKSSAVFVIFDCSVIEVSLSVFEKMAKCDVNTLKGVFNDLSDLCELNDGAVLFQIRKRFFEGIVHTVIGNLLILVNPYQNLGDNGEEYVGKYRDLPLNEKGDPHIYNVASKSLKSIAINRCAQSIIISGDSGAGKTESAKAIMFYFSKVAGSENNIEEKLLGSNPVLEAFGNAKTKKNGNSSRFGKWIEIYFSTEGKVKIKGASVVQYLLEKSRVTRQAPGEQNYHIFYLLCECLEENYKREVFLKESKDYLYLCNSAEKSVSKNRKKSLMQRWVEVKRSLDRMNLPADELHSIVKILSAILSLGNLQFSYVSVDECVLVEDESFEAICSLLEIGKDSLREALTVITRRICGEEIRSALCMKKASDNRDSMAKSLYGKLFEWMVEKINLGLSKNDYRDEVGSIGILDIFGFETFNENYFEQFCINFANEKLQKHFNEQVFKNELEEYYREGLRDCLEPFKDSSSVLDLIERQPSGIIYFLNNECQIPRGNDENFLVNLSVNLGKENGRNNFHDRDNKTFIVSHYARDVPYSVEGFVEKNRDRFCTALGLCLAKSSEKVVGTLYQEFKKGKNKNTLYKEIRSVASNFSSQLSVLMEKIEKTEPWFVRCIRPNNGENPGEFDSKTVFAQMENAGLNAAIRVRANGFAFRKTFSEFSEFYQKALDFNSLRIYNKLRSSRSRTRFLLTTLLDTNNRKEKKIRMGTSKVFYSPAIKKLLDGLRNNNISTSAKTLQKAIKVFFAKRKMNYKKLAMKYLKKQMIKPTLSGITKAFEAANSAEISKIHPLMLKARGLMNVFSLKNEVEEVIKSKNLEKVRKIKASFEKLCAENNYKDVKTFEKLKEKETRLQTEVNFKESHSKETEKATTLRNFKTERNNINGTNATHSKRVEMASKEKENIETVNNNRIEKLKFSPKRTKVKKGSKKEEDLSINKKVEKLETKGDKNYKPFNPFRVYAKTPHCGENLYSFSKEKELAVNYDLDLNRIVFFFKTIRNSHPFSKFSTLRTAKELNALGWKKLRGKKVRSYLKYQNNLIESPLLVIPSEERKSQFESIAMAVEAFKDLLFYQNSQKSTESLHRAVRRFLRMGKKRSFMVDELFSQIIKQTTDCPEEILLRGLKMLFFALRSFAPSKEMRSVVLSHIASIVNFQSAKKSKCNFATSDNATLCCYLLLENEAIATRNDHLSYEEIAAITENRFVTFSVFMSDGRPFTFDVYPLHLFCITIGDVKRAVLERIGLVGTEETGEVERMFEFGIFSFSFPDRTEETIKTSEVGDERFLTEFLTEKSLILKHKRITSDVLMKSSSFVWDRVMFAQTRFMYLHLSRVLSCVEDYIVLSFSHLMTDVQQIELREEEIIRRIKMGQVVPKSAFEIVEEKSFASTLLLRLQKEKRILTKSKGWIEKRYCSMRRFNVYFAERVLCNK